MRQLQEVRISSQIHLLLFRIRIRIPPLIISSVAQNSPELATAAQSNPARFAELVREISQRSRELEIARQREIQLLNADPFDIEAQRKIEEAIREQAVLENRAHALEWSPEAFARVTMLYVEVEVNSHPVKAFVDSGAQSTIMSPDCAEACGIMRLIDTACAGIAKGVGTAKILGRVHSAPLKVADLYLPCSFTVMEGRDVDLLLGLDMLKAHQACIDLEKNVLRIQGREIKFLAEHELHDKARMMNSGEHADSSLDSNEPSSSSSSSVPGGAPLAFPGSGQTLGAAPRAGGVGASSYPEEAIQTLLGLGVTRDEAIRSLELAGGNVDIAASLFF